eukprot:3007643-Amphidinium_carterae.1
MQRARKTEVKDDTATKTTLRIVMSLEKAVKAVSMGSEDSDGFAPTSPQDGFLWRHLRKGRWPTLAPNDMSCQRHSVLTIGDNRSGTGRRLLTTPEESSLSHGKARVKTMAHTQRKHWRVTPQPRFGKWATRELRWLCSSGMTRGAHSRAEC